MHLGAAIWLLVSSWAFVASVAGATESGSDEAKRWLASAAVEVGLDWQEVNQETRPGRLQGPPGPGNYFFNPPRNGNPVFLQNGTSGDRLVNTPIAGMDFELMSPQLTERFGAPRLFVDLNLSALIGRREDHATSGVIGPMGLPENDAGVPIIPETTITGQGTRTDTTLEPFALRAGLGVSFTHVFESGRLIRFKPSVIYNRFEVKVVGETHRAVQLNDPSLEIDDFRLIAVRDARKDVFHGAGPALELEMDTGRMGDFVLSLFVKGHLSFIIGSRSTYLQAPPNEFGETGRYSSKMSRWSARTSTGFRVRWNPE